VDCGPFDVAACWLGQAGFVLRTEQATALIDPFLSPHDGRLYESSLAPADCSGVDVVLCTHEHLDHFDAPSASGIAAASPQARFVVPEPIADLVARSGVPPERIAGVQPGERIEVAGLVVQPVPACHGISMADAYGFGEELSGGLVRFLGYVVEAGGSRLYHAGDTIHYPGMEDALREMGADVALLPINGRDPEREARDIVGNLSEREAAWLAIEIGADVLVPMHHDLFAGNLGDVAHLARCVERAESPPSLLMPARDRPFVYRAARRGGTERP
jgi:L-ascorbate 6-phosphate lactonase